MPAMVAPLMGRPANRRRRMKSKPFSFRLRAQPGTPITEMPARVPVSSRLPGSTGMPKRSTRPPACSIAAGIWSARSITAWAPTTRMGIGTAFRHVAECLDQRRRRMVDDETRADAPAQPRNPRGHRDYRLVDHGILGGFGPGHDHADGQGGEGGDRDGGRVAGGGDRAVEHGAGHGEGHDLDRRQHLARFDHFIRRYRRDGDRLVHKIDRVDARGIDAGKPGACGMEIGAGR